MSPTTFSPSTATAPTASKSSRKLRQSFRDMVTARSDCFRWARDKEIFRRDGFRCVYCDFDGKTFEGWVFLAVDHFKPKSRGGSDEPDNLVTACVSCNHMKGAFEFSSLDAARAEVENGGIRCGVSGTIISALQPETRPLRQACRCSQVSSAS